MATEVKHGKNPKFKVKLQPGANGYHVTVTGHYTVKDGLAAAGVTEVVWQSDRDIKRRSELLSLRSAFLGWFMYMWIEQGGKWDAGVREITGYPYFKIRHGLSKQRNSKLRKWAKRPGFWQLYRWLRWEDKPVAHSLSRALDIWWETR